MITAGKEKNQGGFPMNFQPFEYMAWAKAHAGLPGHQMLQSGMRPFPPEILGTPPLDLTLEEVDPYGPKAVAERIAARHGLGPGEVFLSGGGSSMGLFLVCLALLEKNDLVLAETPGYQALHRVPLLAGARVEPLPRPAGQGARVDRDALEEGLSRGARMVLLTNLHNPTGALLEGLELEGIAQACARAGAVLVVDEVFAEFLPPEKRPPAAHALHEGAVTLSSFTKAFGLGSLRAGWILASPERVRRLEQVNDMVQVANPTLPFQVLLRVLEREGAVRSWLEKEMAGVAKARARLKASPLLEFPEPAGGVTLFAAFPGVEDTGELCRFLAEEKEVHLVPGAFFGDPSRVRIGLALSGEALDLAVRALRESLEDFLNRRGR